MIQYRPYHNPDSPAVVEAWNSCFAGPRVVSVRLTTVLEYFTLAKPYFDPAGLILAFDDERPVGLAHASFGPTADGSAIDLSTGVLCTLGVVPSHRRRGIGGELLRRAEDYLKGQGAKEILAGPLAPNNPFNFGLYGGCDTPGFLVTDALAGPFLEKRGYQVARSVGVFQRPLAKAYLPPDPRFATIRMKYDIVAAPFHQAGWWRECVLGPIESVEYRLQEKNQGAVRANCVLWDMETFTQGWGESCVGLIDLFVEPTHRRQGLAKYLMAQILRHLRDQPFTLFEALAPLDEPAALGLLQTLEFHPADTGHVYRRVGA